jgi:RNA polymerase sigma factor for flagellar operon FliA
MSKLLSPADREPVVESPRVLESLNDVTSGPADVGEFLSVRDLLHRPSAAGTEDLVAKDVLIERLSHAIDSLIDSLSERDRLILNLYYDEQLTPHEISFVLEECESRMTHLHGAAVTKLHALLRT